MSSTESSPAIRIADPDRSSRIPVIPLLGATAMVNMGFGGVFALLAELQDRFALPTWGLGVMIGSSFVVALVSQLVLAKQADRGHAKKLLLTGVLASVIGLAWMGLFATTLLEFTIARGVLSLGEGALMPAARRIVVLRNPDAAGQQLGQLGSAAIAGFLVGSPAGAFMASAWGTRAPFLIMAAGCAVFVPSLAGLSVPAGPVVDSTKGLMAKLARIPAVRAGIALTAAEYVSIGVFDSIWARYLTDLGAGPVFIGVSLAMFAAPLAILSPFGGRLADRRGAFRVGVITLALTVPCQALYGAFDSLILVTGIVLVHTVFEAIAVPATQAAVADAAPAEAVASGQGLAQSVGLAAAGLTALVAPAGYGWLGAGWLFAGSAVAMVLLIGVAVLYSDRPTVVTPEPALAGAVL
jgi:MFS family permease